jgi:signal transduction histidine kinase/CheY-like chemotaxis protein
MENTTPKWQKIMEIKKMKYSVLASWLIVTINPFWCIFDYFTIEDNIDLVLTLDIIATSLVLVAVLIKDKLKLSAEVLGGFTLFVTSFAITLPQHLVGLDDFEIMTFSCVALYVGAGMIYLWNIRFSLLMFAIIVGMNVAFFMSIGHLSLMDFMEGGGILILTILIVMVASIQIKYTLTKREVSMTIDLKEKQVELIEAKNQAEDSKKLQGQFLSNMSHEIRTPMNGILGITRVLQKTELDDEQKKYLNAIKRSADNLMVIINDILDFSKIEAGRLEIENTSFNILERMQSLEDVLRIKAEDKSVYLQVKIEDSVPEWIIGDPVRLNQILLNLAGNALKFTEEGGVTINVSSEKQSDSKVALKFDVIDTGIGIPKEKLNDIFMSFTQANSDTTRKFGGTGLGLTITKNLIELQGGTLSVESEESKGSTFSFTLNYEVDAKTIENDTDDSGKEERELLKKIGDINVLLVEDHDINQMLAMKVLSDWGFNVELAVNGVEAVDMVSKNPYDIVLMDISMPEMDGYTATRMIRTTLPAPTNQISIVAMTASALIGENEKCFKAGMNDYVPKPFDPALLLQKIAENVN